MTISTGVRLTGDQLTALQALSAQHIAFSLTEACPLACRHCIVSTVSAADRSRTMPLQDAERYAAEFPSLQAQGIRTISFTGGEPLLVPKHLALLSGAAVRAGLRCTVVTACHWAVSDRAARRVVAQFPHIANWHLSTDIFHAEFIPLDQVVRAARVAMAEGRKVVMRITVSVPVTDCDLQLQEELCTHLPDGVSFIVQPVTKIGRAATLEMEVATAGVPAWLCVPSGITVRYDGTLSPCCSALIDQCTGHPFEYANARETSLKQAYQAWCTDPLLQIMRAVGFAPLLQWVDESFPEHPVLRAIPRDPCQCCVQLWEDPAVGPALRERAARPENRAKIASLTTLLFGNSFAACGPSPAGSG